MRELLLAIVSVLLGQSSAQDANCDFVQTVQAGEVYYVSNKNYPQNYTSGVQCRWIATCPLGYNCRLDCSEINLPQTSGCSQDRLLISKSGDPQLNAAETYCGRGSLTAVSTGKKISIGLITANTSPGGRFTCQLRAQLASSTNTSCQCGYKKTNRIVGGVETGVNEYPSMAGIVDIDIFAIKCGGVIIDKRYVLSAAHCLVNRRVDNTAVVVGEHNVDTGDSPATQGIRASGFIIHPQYSSSTYDNDIAIVVLASEIKFSDRVGPICLPYKFVRTDMTGQMLTVLGWGTQFAGGPTSNVLMKTDLKVISQADCRTAISSLTSRQICTYTPGKDACQDDSGGPLFYTDKATGLLFNIAIVSYGQFCATAGRPGVNTKVTEFLNWIESVTPQANYCRK